MPRFNAFFMIHKGLRAMMYDVSLSLQHADFSHEYPHALERLEHVLEIFDAHAGHEDNFLFPLLESCDPALQEDMEKEHVTDIALSNELRSLMTSFKSAASTDEKRALGSKICYTYYEFIAFNLIHLNKEEIVVNGSLWKHYEDEEIIKANMSMIATLTPEEVKRNAIWMMRGCSNPDIIGWLGMVKRQAPEQVLKLLLSIAEEELPSQRFEAVQNAVMEMV